MVQHASITVYNAASTTVPKSVASIPVSHVILRAEDDLEPLPAHVHIAAEAGAPFLIWGKPGFAEVVAINVKSKHAIFERRDLHVYIKPSAAIAAAPEVFWLRTAIILCRMNQFKLHTQQVIITDEHAVPQGDDVPWPVICMMR